MRASELEEIVKQLTESQVGLLVRSRLKEFKQVREWFPELCFCITTAYSSARMGLKIQESIGDGFYNYSRRDLTRFLKKVGYRFPNTRAGFIFEARKHAGNLRETINSFNDEREAREWLVKNVKGIGYKEASHFLRNVGHWDVAILDSHVLKVLNEFGLLKKIPKSLNRKKYLETEKLLEGIASRLGMSLGELDLYLWYLKTGEVLK